MEFLTSAFQAIPQAAASPYALVAYVVAVLAWVAIAYRVRRNEIVITNIDKLPPGDRRVALEAEMGSAVVNGGISPEHWLKQKRQFYYFLGFLALLSVCVCVFVVATSVRQNETAKSKAELGAVLQERAQSFLASIDLLMEMPAVRDPSLSDLDNATSENYFKGQLRSIRKDAYELFRKQNHALGSNNLVQFYELGNQLNALAGRFEPLTKMSGERVYQLRKSGSQVASDAENERNRALIKLGSDAGHRFCLPWC
ncbi:hypothetical protein [Rhizobium leguminosarum]|uniref:hypothetical protein n=1 Tax=Rhizobium leguminosarum TaxID=384 RepID=UPI0004A3A5B1|nr:hypothetical protein [Rhizobium leguminosarum]